MQNSKKRAERSEYYGEQPDYLPLWLSASSSACHGLLDHYRDNAITYKAQRDKNARELKLANAAITDMQMRQCDVAALDAKYTKELAGMLKLKMMLCVMMLPLVVVGCIKAVCQSVREATIASGVDTQMTGEIPLNGIISPSERLITMQNNWKEPRSILMSSVDRALISMGNSCNYC